MADTGYLEFSYNEAEVNEITSYLTSTKNRLNEYNLTSLISQLQNCRGWSRVVSASGTDYIAQLNTYKDSGTNYAGAIEKERARIADTLAALKAFDGEVVTTETNWWASAGMAFFNFTEGFLTGFEQVLDGLMTGAAVLTGWLGLEGISNALTTAVEFEIFGEMFDYLFENVEFFKNIEEHAAWAHDDSQADFFKGAGTLTSYIVMAAMGGGALGKGFNVLGKTVQLAGGAWTGPASIVADMVITGVGTLGAETQKELQAQEVNDINAAAWAAMDDVVLSTIIAGGAGAAFEFGPGLVKKGFQGAKAFFSEAAEEGAQAGTRALTGEVVEGGAKNLLGEGAEAGARNAAGNVTQESVEASVKNVVGDTTQNAATKIKPTDVFDTDLADDAVREFMQNGSGEMDVVLFRSQNGSVTGMAKENFEQQAQEFFEQTGKDFVEEMNQRGVDVFSDTMVKNGPGQEGFKSMLADSADNIVGDAADNIVGDAADNIVGDSADNIVGDSVDNIRPNNDVTDLVPIDNTPTIKPNPDVTDLVPAGAADNFAREGAEDTALAIVNKGAGEAGQGLMREGAQEAGERFAREGAEEAGQGLMRQGAEEAGQGLMRQGAEEVGEGLMKQGAEEAVENVAKKGAKETIENITKKAIIHGADDLLPDSEAQGNIAPPDNGCPICGQTPCVCPIGGEVCPVCGQNPCVCPIGGGGNCPVCGQNPCVCPIGGGGNCPNCGQNPCVCPTGGGGTCPNCGQNPCVCPIEPGTTDPTDPTPCPNCGQNPCVCPTEPGTTDPTDPTVCPNCGQNPCICPTEPDTTDPTDPTVCPNCGQNPCVCPTGPSHEWPTGGPGDIIDDITTGEDSDISSLTDKFGDAAGLGEIIDLASGVNIPTSPDPIRTKINPKDNKMIPLMAGLGAAALAGLGTKAYLERKENKDEEDEIEADEWEEEDAAELALNTEAYDNELEESDYLLPTDEYAFQPEGAEISQESELDDEDRYHAVNSSDLPSMN